MAKAARNRGAVKSGSQRQVPGWVWLFSGVVTGLFIAFLFHLAQLQSEHPPQQQNDTAETAQQPERDGTDSADDSKDGPKFDFYAVLPKMEVIVPEGEKQKERESGQDDADATSRPDLSHRHDQHFLLQAGSFGTAKDADRRRAQLTLQGYDVRIQQVKLDGGQRWHRVMVGPFDNVNAMHRAQDKLASAGIDTLPIRKKNRDANGGD